MKKDYLQILIKVLIYALGLIGTYLGITTLSSCTTSHAVQSYGKATIVTVDTTYIKHDGYVKSKNYIPYETQK